MVCGVLLGIFTKLKNGRLFVGMFAAISFDCMMIIAAVGVCCEEILRREQPEDPKMLRPKKCERLL